MKRQRRKDNKPEPISEEAQNTPPDPADEEQADADLAEAAAAADPSDSGAEDTDAALAGSTQEGDESPATDDAVASDDETPIDDAAATDDVASLDDTESPSDPAISGEEPSPMAVVEALLFSTDAPLPPAKLAMLVGSGDGREMKRLVDALNEKYEATQASFRIERIAGGYQMLTLPQFNVWLGQLRKARSESRLSAAALETLAIIAYKQPILRADVEAIRGVASGEMLIRLRDMNLIRIVGRAEEIGRPLLYGTTRRFLDAFGLNSLVDLPNLDQVDGDHVPELKLAASESEEDAGATDEQPAASEEDPPGADGESDDDAAESPDIAAIAEADAESLGDAASPDTPPSA
jgi:segregation and condensation protein B